MTTSTHVEKYQAFIDCQLNPKSKHPFVPPKLRLSITLSRQHGCGALPIAEDLAKFLLDQSRSPKPWMIFDKNLAEKVLEEHHLPKEIARFMPEDSVQYDLVINTARIPHREVAHLIGEAARHWAETL